jgi:hypothetical protein
VIADPIDDRAVSVALDEIDGLEELTLHQSPALT